MARQARSGAGGKSRGQRGIWITLPDALANADIEGEVPLRKRNGRQFGAKTERKDREGMTDPVFIEVGADRRAQFD